MVTFCLARRGGFKWTNKMKMARPHFCNLFEKMQEMNSDKKGISLGWAVLFSVIINIFFNILSSIGEINGQPNGEIFHQYNSPFTPADFTFGIWSLIYISYLVYAAAQLLPTQREKIIYRELALPFIAVNLLSVAWLYLFSYKLLGLSVLVIFIMLVLSLLLFHRVRIAKNMHKVSTWLTIPFSLLSGWLSVTFLANLATWATNEGNPLSNDAATSMILVAALAAVIINLRYRDWLYPLVIAWANFGIWSANRELNDRVAAVAIGVVFFLVGWSVILFLIRSMRPTRLHDNYYN